MDCIFLYFLKLAVVPQCSAQWLSNFQHHQVSATDLQPFSNRFITVNKNLDPDRRCDKKVCKPLGIIWFSALISNKICSDLYPSHNIRQTECAQADNRLTFIIYCVFTEHMH